MLGSQSHDLGARLTSSSRLLLGIFLFSTAALKKARFTLSRGAFGYLLHQTTTRSSLVGHDFDRLNRGCRTLNTFSRLHTPKTGLRQYQAENQDKDLETSEQPDRRVFEHLPNSIPSWNFGRPLGIAPESDRRVTLGDAQRSIGVT